MELDAKQQTVARLLDEASKRLVTLLYSARYEEYNQAVALREYLISKAGNRAR